MLILNDYLLSYGGYGGRVGGSGNGGGSGGSGSGSSSDWGGCDCYLL